MVLSWLKKKVKRSDSLAKYINEPYASHFDSLYSLLLDVSIGLWLGVKVVSLTPLPHHLISTYKIVNTFSLLNPSNQEHKLIQLILIPFLFADSSTSKHSHQQSWKGLVYTVTTCFRYLNYSHFLFFYEKKIIGFDNS